MKLLKLGIEASAGDAPPPGDVVFRSFSVLGNQSTIGTANGNGLIRTVPAPLDNWLVAMWVLYLNNRGGFNTMFAGTLGQEQFFNGSADTVRLRSSNDVGNTVSGSGALVLNDWSHFFLRFDKTNNTRGLSVNGGTEIQDVGASNFDGDYELDLNNSIHHLMQDDGEDGDFDAIFFDIIALNLDTSTLAIGPTDINFSPLNGGQWKQFTDFASFGPESYQIAGQDLAALFNDNSGNGNHFTESGAPIVDRTNFIFGGVPPGADDVLESVLQLDLSGSIVFSEGQLSALSLPNFVSFSPNQKTFTIALWVKLDDITPGTTGMFLRLTDGFEGVSSLELDGVNDNLQFLNFLFSTFPFGEQLANPFVAGQWHHLCCAVDTTEAVDTDRVKLYFDGVLQAAGIGTLAGFLPQDADTPMFENGLQVVVGRATFGGFDGKIADLIVIEGEARAPENINFDPADGGGWKAYVGSVGAHGFRINPGDSDEIGKDQSGNGYNFNPVNMDSSNFDSVDAPPIASKKVLRLNFGAFDDDSPANVLAVDGGLDWIGVPLSDADYPVVIENKGVSVTSTNGAMAPFGAGPQTYDASVPSYVPQAVGPTAGIGDRLYFNQDFTVIFTGLNPAKQFTVNLFFNEPFFDAGEARVFDVLVNDVVVLTGFDAFVEAGGRDITIMRSHTFTPVLAGAKIQLVASVDAAVLCGLELIELRSSP